MLSEALLSVATPLASKEPQVPSCSLHSLASGSQIYSFKTVAPSSTIGYVNVSPDTPSFIPSQMSVLETTRGHAGLVAMISGARGTQIVIWSFQKDQVQQRLNSPVPLATILFSPNRKYIAAGAIDGKLLVWNIMSGALLASHDAHFRKITCIQFDESGYFLATGSEDSNIHLWHITNLLSQNPDACLTFSGHLLTVTGLKIGIGAFPNFRIFSSSLDRTVKIWSLTPASVDILQSYSFPHPCLGVDIDLLERYCIVAGLSHAYIVYITPSTDHRTGIIIDPTASVDVARSVQPDPQHTITSLHLSKQSPSLVLGFSNGSLKIFSVPDLVPVRELSLFAPGGLAKGPVSFVSTFLRPPDLGSVQAPGQNWPFSPIPPLQLSRRPWAPTKGGPQGSSICASIPETCCSLDLILHRDTFPVDAFFDGAPDFAPLPEAVPGPSGSVVSTSHELKDAFSKAASLNDALWKNFVSQAFNDEF